MALLRRAGRLVSENRAARAGALGAIGLGAAALGVGSAVFHKDGMYQREIIPNAQELAFGNPRMMQDSVREGITAALAGGTEEDVDAVNDYYYSRPVDVRGNPNLGIPSLNQRHGKSPVSGDLVFGMYNLRR